MKSVGEAMAIGRNFTEALQKALRSLEKQGLARSTGTARRRTSPRGWPSCSSRPAIPTDGRIVTVQQALRAGAVGRGGPRGHRHRPVVPRPDRAHQRGRRPGRGAPRSSTPTLLRLAKRHGFSDAQIAALRGMPEAVVRGVRHALGRAPGLQDGRHLRGRVRRARRRTTTRTYDEETEVAPRERPAVDHPRLRARTGSARASSSTTPACTPASRCATPGFDTVMVNCNPETVSTDYDTSEPALLRAAHPRGRARGRPRRAAGRAGRRRHRPARRPDPARPGARRSRTAGVPIVGTSPEAIDLAEDRGAFGRVLAEAGLPAPKHGTAYSADGGRSRSPRRSATRCSCARPTCSAAAAWRSSTTTRRWPTYVTAGHRCVSPEHPVLVDRFLDDAIEIDVDALYDGTEMYLGGIMEHIEEAGIHSGDSACTLPPVTLGRDRARAGPRVDAQAGRGHRRARADERAVRPGPGRPLRARGQPARVAHRAVRRQGHRRAARQGRRPGHARRDDRRAARGGHAARRTATAARCRAHAPVAVKEAVLPFKRFRTREGQVVDSLLGPEMRSTGEVMGIDRDFGDGVRQEPAGRVRRPAATTGTVFVSVANRDKRAMIFPVKRLADLGFDDHRHQRHRGGAAPQRDRGRRSCASTARARPGRASRPSSTCINAGEIDMVVNTPTGRTRAPTATRSARPRRRWTSRSSPRCRSSAPRCRASRPSCSGEFGVKSLQDHARDLDLYGAARRRRWGPVRDRRATRQRLGHAAARAVRRRPGDRRAHRDPAGRRLPPPDLRGPRHRRAGPAGPVRRPRRRRRHRARTCCAAASRSTRSARRAPTAAPSTSSSRARAGHRRGSPGCAPHDEVDIVGPLGRPFPLPNEPVACVLVGGGYGSAPLFWLAEALRERGCHVEMVLGAATEDRLFGVVEARRARRRRHGHHRRRLGRAPGAGSPTCCRR